MNTEQKAKAYDEALERARKQKYDYQKELDKTDKSSQLAGILRAGISAIELAFPELADSEDERIRKALISYFEWVKERDCKSEWNGLKVDDIRAWLEKQKHLYETTKDRFYSEGFEEGQLYEKRKEQKPAECIPDSIKFDEGFKTGREVGFREGVESVKSIEWSEEDEKMVRFYEADYNNQIGDMPMIDVINMRLKFKNWLTNRLKFIRPQPKQNVNDMIITPNKKFFQWIYDRLVNVHNEDPNVDYMISFKRRIEELSVDKPSWKPSEEQMEMLAMFANLRCASKREGDILESLYNDLKKL